MSTMRLPERGEMMNRILENEAALTTPYRNAIYTSAKGYWDYVLPKEVDGLFSVYCKAINRDTGKPKEAFLYYVVQDKKDLKEACRRIGQSFQMHKTTDLPFNAMIVYASNEAPIEMYGVMQNKDGIWEEVLTDRVADL